MESKESAYQRVCKAFVDSVKKNFPELSRKLKVHLFLHLTDNMMDFGPTSSFNTERSVISHGEAMYLKVIISTAVSPSIL